MPHRFSAGSRVEICWRPRGNARIVRGSVQSSADERGSIRTWLKMCGYQLLNPCSHVTAEALSNGQPFCHTHPRITFYTYVYLWSRNKTCSASQATSRTYVREWLSPFSARIRMEFLSRFFRTVSCRKSVWYHAENPSASTQISVSACAGNSRNSSEKCKLSVSRIVVQPNWTAWTTE